MEENELAKTIAQRLAKKSIPEPNSGCLLWVGTINNWGYGVVACEGRRLAAHRLSYEEACGPIPAGLHVLHKCDVPSCINPAHLFLGTNLDNIRDRELKGRGRVPQQRGESNANAILREQDVRAILADSRTAKAIAADYDVAAGTIGAIKSGHAWKWIERNAG